MRMPIIVIVMAMFLFWLPNAQAEEQEWYEGGTLHAVTMEQWLKASYRDKTATSADFSLQFEAVNKIVKDSRNIDTAKFFAVDMATCLDEFARGGIDHTATAEDRKTILDSLVATSAALCGTMMGWQ